VTSWKLAPELLSKCFSGVKPRVYALKIVPVTIAGGFASFKVSLVDVGGEVLAYLPSSPAIREGDSFTIEGIDRSFEVNVSSY